MGVGGVLFDDGYDFNQECVPSSKVREVWRPCWLQHQLHSKLPPFVSQLLHAGSPHSPPQQVSVFRMRRNKTHTHRTTTN